MNKLTIVANRINIAHELCQDTFKKSLEQAMDVGELLIEAKRMVKHGEWLDWVHDNLSFSTRKASSYIRIVNNRHRLPESAGSAVLSIDSALGMLAEPKIKPHIIARETLEPTNEANEVPFTWRKDVRIVNMLESTKVIKFGLTILIETKEKPKEARYFIVAMQTFLTDELERVTEHLGKPEKEVVAY